MIHSEKLHLAFGVVQAQIFSTIITVFIYLTRKSRKMNRSLPLQINFLLASILLSACNTASSPSPIKTNSFAGKYQGTYENSITTLVIKDENQTISGVFTLGNQSFILNGTSNQDSFSGEIVDEQSGNFHKIVAQIQGDILNLQITFPEYNYQVLELSLSRTQGIAVAENNPESEDAIAHHRPKNLSGDSALVGKWRFTESFSSGSGEFYMSFSTDYFMRINADGTAISWIGQSAGGSDSMTIEGNYGSNLREFGWYTKGNQFFMVDPSHKEADESVEYYAESNRMMISNGNDKRVWERVE